MRPVELNFQSLLLLITGKRSFPAVNYEDPNFNVGIPVFSIHGNHDDPQGAGVVSRASCSLTHPF